MKFDISRDFLDAVMVQHPVQGEANKEVKVNSGMHFLPSSPDGTMHTAIISFALQIDGQEQPFAKAGWRFLFTSSEAFEPKEAKDEPFLQHLLIAGRTKVLAVLNPLCLHANMPLIPLDPARIAAAHQQQQQQAAAES